jgi:tripartite-type tricarboxylate transporter receptor subunit TctC
MKLARYLLAATVAACAVSAAADSYPSRPVRLILPSGAGGITDILARVIAPRLTQALGQQVVVDNRPGASGIVGSSIVAKSAPDGYTLLVTTAALPVSAHVYPNLKYDTAKDFAAVTLISTSPLLLAANNSFGPRTIAELVQYAKANPGKVAFGSAGVGTSHHLTGEKLKLDTGIDLVHVPYKGSGPAHVDLMGGQIPLMFDNIVALMPHVKAGKVRAIAVSSAKRNAMLPDVPTIAESGVPGFETVAWFGLAVPAGTPRELIHRLHGEAIKAMKLPDVEKRLLDSGSDVVGASPEAADKFLRDEVGKWGVVVKAAGVKPN